MSDAAIVLLIVGWPFSGLLGWFLGIMRDYWDSPRIPLDGEDIAMGAVVIGRHSV